MDEFETETNEIDVFLDKMIKIKLLTFKNLVKNRYKSVKFVAKQLLYK